MYRVRSGGWVWRFLDAADWETLGPRPDERAADTETVKVNPVRGVFRRAGYYLKCEMPHSTGCFSIWREILLPRARREFRSLCRLRRLGIPAVEPVAWGQSLAYSMLITRAWAGGVAAGDWFCRSGRRDPERRAAFLRGWSAFFRRLREAPLYHADFHNGNILYRPETGEFALVDAMAVRRRRWFDALRPLGMARILADFRSMLSKAELCALIRDCGLPGDPEAIYARLWRRSAAFTRHEWKKRRRQFLAGYPKFTLEKEGVIYALDLARDPVATPESLPQLEQIELPPEAAEARRVEDFRLFLTGIPALRVAAYRAPGTLYCERAAGEADAAQRAELREMLELSGLDPEGFDYVTGADGRPCVRRK